MWTLGTVIIGRRRSSVARPPGGTARPRAGLGGTATGTIRGGVADLLQAGPGGAALLQVQAGAAPPCYRCGPERRLRRRPAIGAGRSGAALLCCYAAPARQCPLPPADGRGPGRRRPGRLLCGPVLCRPPLGAGRCGACWVINTTADESPPCCLSVGFK